MREGAILAQIYKDADENDKILVEKYFLTTVCHGDVLMEPGVIDDTEKGLMRGLEISGANVFKLPRKKLAITKDHSAPGSNLIRATSRLRARHPSVRYSHKTHYRIVFKEQGTTIDDVRSLPDVLTVLAETATGASLCISIYLQNLIFFSPALQPLRKLRWVHRDVSIGNILSYEGGAKLADLEYAKKMDDMADCHNMRTASVPSIDLSGKLLTIFCRVLCTSCQSRSLHINFYFILANLARKSICRRENLKG
jgi:hypothetical protein